MTPVLLLLLFFSVTAVAQEETNSLDDPEVSGLLESVNEGLPNLIYGDIAPNSKRNADPCTATGCKWPKYGRYVRVPVAISSSYSQSERNIIIRSLVTFHRSTCIRFVWRRWYHRNYLYFMSGSGCWSYVGRQSRGQTVSLKKSGCLYTGTIQHEVLHALGFHHEQVRSDRDRYIRVLTENIMSGKLRNFSKVRTNNLATRYDFKSVMQYHNRAFSKNGRPTLEARRYPNLVFGRARYMSSNDITRVNRLYQCRV